jgi:hypothetical protein
MEKSSSQRSSCSSRGLGAARRVRPAEDGALGANFFNHDSTQDRYSDTDTWKVESTQLSYDGVCMCIHIWWCALQNSFVRQIRESNN